MFQYAVLIFFPTLMVWAAVSDLTTMTISNRISIALVVIYLAMAIAAGHTWASIGYDLACGALVLTLTFAMFAFGWIGGGDAKLSAATAVWFGFTGVMAYAAVSAVFGGLLTLGLLQFRSIYLPEFLSNQKWLAHLHRKETGVPYGIALAAAGLFLYPETGIWRAAI